MEEWRILRFNCGREFIVQNKGDTSSLHAATSIALFYALIDVGPPLYKSNYCVE